MERIAKKYIWIFITSLTALLLAHDLFNFFVHDRGYKRSFLFPLGPKILYRNIDPHGEWYTDVVPGANFFSFRALNDDYAKDKKNAYHQNYFMTGVDVPTFVAFDRTYAKDKSFLYHWKDKVVATDFDIPTLEVIGPFLKDKSGLYYPTFEWNTLNGQRLYEPIFQKIEYVDVPSFRVLNYGYSKDAKAVYMSRARTEVLEGADPESFQVLDYGYAKDKNEVYFSGDRIQGADPATFRTLDIGPNRDYAQDKNGIYLFGKIISTDPDSFEYKPIEPT